jgi:dihydroorotase
VRPFRFSITNRNIIMNEITISVPDDFHHHLRDGEVLPNVVEYCASSFHNVLVMPNIKPPVRTVEEAEAYLARILEAGQVSSSSSSPNYLMTLYLTDTTTPEEIIKVSASDNVYALKLYPAGATTNSEFGVTSYDKIKPCLAKMSELQIPLLVHGEVTDPTIDIFDREAVFIENKLKPIISEFPDLLIVMEHITTKQAVDFVTSEGPNLAATITAHHMLYNRNSLFKGGICPHMYCLPILKREEHRLALIEAATSGNPKFFLGTDSAPHSLDAKETACGCAGIFTGHAPLELYAEVFDNVGKLDKLENFASQYGRQFYRMKAETEERPKVTLVKEEWTVPDSYNFGSKQVRPLRAGETIAFRKK